MDDTDALYDDMAKQWLADPSPTTSDRALSTFKPLIDAGIHRYAGQVTPLVRSRAKQLTLDALGKYHPQQGAFKPYLMSNLQGLKRYAAQQQQWIHVPERVVLENQKLHFARQELQDELNREPSDSELADRTGFSVKRIGYLRQYHPGMAEGHLDSAFMAMGDGGESGADELAVAQPSIEQHLVELVYPSLTPTDQLIVDYSLGRNGRRRTSVQEIARRLNISPGAVSQRAAKIQQKIDSLSDMELL